MSVHVYTRSCREAVNKAQWTHRLFRVGVPLKGVDGVLEVLGGFLLLVVTADSIHSLAWTLIEREDPTDGLTGICCSAKYGQLRQSELQNVNVVDH